MFSNSSVPPPHSPPSLALGFVAFRPDPSFYDRIELAVGMGIRVFVFDNAPDALDHVRLGALGHGCLHYTTAGNNLGLGVGLSAICASAYMLGCDYLLFFDQDTRFAAETLTYAARLLEKHAVQRKASHAAIVLRGPCGPGVDHQPIDTLLAISSGSIYLLQNLARIGWHNPRYFVDGVDYEFCLRARAHNFLIAVCSGAPGFDHVSDQADATVTVFGRNLRLRRYPPSRVFDSLSAYGRLAATSVGRGDLGAFYSVLRSMAIFVSGQCLAHLLLPRSN